MNPLFISQQIQRRATSKESDHCCIIAMCPYCQFCSVSANKCDLCDEFQSNVEDLLTTAWSLQHSINTETAAITRLVEIHGQSLSLQTIGESGVQVLQIERDRQVQEHENMLQISDELSVMYSVELKDIERSLLMLTEEANLYGVNVKHPLGCEDNVTLPQTADEIVPDAAEQD